jgi:hypothetical protein
MRIAFQNYPLEQCPEYIITIDDTADPHKEIKRRMISPNMNYRWRMVNDDEESMIAEPPVRR